MAASDSSSGAFTVLVGFALICSVGVLAGMVYVPPYFANREVKTAVASTLERADPTQTDDQLISTMNTFLMDAKTTRYWVEENKQQQALDFKLDNTKVTFTRDGNQQVSADVDYTQEMWVPLMNKKKVLRYYFHVDGARH